MKSKTLYVGTSVKQARKLGNTTTNMGDAMKLARNFYESGLDGKMPEVVNIYNGKEKITHRYGEVKGNVGWYDAKNKPLKVEDQVEAIIDDAIAPSGKVEVVEAMPQVELPPIVNENDSTTTAVEAESDTDTAAEASEDCLGCNTSECGGCATAEVEAKVDSFAFSITPIEVNNDTFGAIPLSAAFSIKGDSDKFYVKVGKTSALVYSSDKVEKVRLPKKQRIKVREVEVKFALN